MESNAIGPAWLSTWQAICEQETQAKIRYKKFTEEWYRIETKMKLMDLRVDAMLRMRDDYLTYLFQKYPNWKPTFTSYGLRSSTPAPDHQSDLYRLMETEIMRSLQQRETAGPQYPPQASYSQQPTANSFSTPLLPYSNPYLQRFMTPQSNPFNMSAYTTSSNSGYPGPATSYQMVPHDMHLSTTNDQPANSQIGELKTEMAQIKLRLEDITVYLRELRHSAIELTTSVSRRSSMRDKDRKRAPILDHDDDGMASGGQGAFVRGNAVGFERNLTRDERRQDTFVDQVKEKLIQEKRQQNTVHYQDDDDDINSDISYQQKPTPVAPKPQPQKAAPPVQVPPKPQVAEINIETVAPSNKPRFDFGSATHKPPEPKPMVPPSPLTDDDVSTASDSPPATATWLMSGEKPKQATAAAPAPKPAPATEPPKPTKKQPQPPPAEDSSPASSPEMRPKVQQATGGGYQALLGAMSKTPLDAKSTSKSDAAKYDGSDSDDLDHALANVVKSPPAKARDASLSDIFSFGKREDTSAKAPSKILSPEKPKTAPAAIATSMNKPKDPILTTKKETTTAEPDDFLKKLFPDKFAAPASGNAGKPGSAPNLGAKKKKAAFFLGDDESDDDIDLPQGNKKDDLDDDFFFR